MNETTRLLPCKITDPDKVRLADELADLYGKLEDQRADIDKEKDELKELTKAAKGLEAKQRHIMKALNTGLEDREVAVEEKYIQDQDLVQIYRTDTGEAIDVRPATDEDRQLSLDLSVEKDGTVAVRPKPLEVPPNTPPPLGDTSIPPANPPAS